MSTTIIEFKVDDTKSAEDNMKELLRQVYGDNVDMYTWTAEDFRTLDNMEKYGGSFVKALANLCRHADLHNAFVIRHLFNAYFQKYQEDNIRRGSL